MKTKKILISLLLMVLMAVPLEIQAADSGTNASNEGGGGGYGSCGNGIACWSSNITSGGNPISGVRISVWYSNDETGETKLVSDVADFVRESQATKCNKNFDGSTFSHFKECMMNFNGNKTVRYKTPMARADRVGLNDQGVFDGKNNNSDNTYRVYSWGALKNRATYNNNTIVKYLTAAINGKRTSDIKYGVSYVNIFDYDNLPVELQELFKIINFTPPSGKANPHNVLEWQNYYIEVESLAFIKRTSPNTQSWYGSVTDVATMISGNKLDEDVLPPSWFQTRYSQSVYVKLRKQFNNYYLKTAALTSIYRFKSDGNASVIKGAAKAPKLEPTNAYEDARGYYTKPTKTGKIYGVATGHVWLGSDLDCAVDPTYYNPDEWPKFEGDENGQVCCATLIDAIGTGKYAEYGLDTMEGIKEKFPYCTAPECVIDDPTDPSWPQYDGDPNGKLCCEMILADPAKYGFKDANEIYTKFPYCKPAGCNYDISYSMPDSCDVDVSGYAHDGGSDDDESQWQCIFDASRSSDATIKSHYTEWSNRYCTIMCREDIDYTLPNSGFTVLSGMRFTINDMGADVGNLGGINFSGQSSCRSLDDKIDYEKYTVDYAAADKVVRDAYTKLKVAQTAASMSQGVQSCTYYVTKYTSVVQTGTHMEQYACNCTIDSKGREVCQECSREVPTYTTYSLEETCRPEAYSCTPVSVPTAGYQNYIPAFTVTSGTGYATFSSSYPDSGYSGGTSSGTISVMKQTGVCGATETPVSVNTSSSTNLLSSAISARSNYVTQLSNCNNFMRVYGEFDPQVTFTYTEPLYGGVYDLKATKNMTAYTDYYKDDSKLTTQSWNTSYYANSTTPGLYEYYNGMYGSIGQTASWNCTGTDCSEGKQDYQTNDYVRSYTLRDYTYDLDPARQYYHYIAKGSGMSYHTLTDLRSGGGTEYYYLGYNNLPVGYSTPTGSYPFYVKFLYTTGGAPNLFGRNQKFFNRLLNSSGYANAQANSINAYIFANALDYVRDGNTGDHTMPAAFNTKLGSRMDEFTASDCYRDYGCLIVNDRVYCDSYQNAIGNWKEASTASDFSSVYSQLRMCISSDVSSVNSSASGVNTTYSCALSVDSLLMETCPGCKGLNVVYRPIDLTDPFPGESGTGRNSGVNWTGTDIKEDIHENRGVNEDEVYNLTPMYQFVLTPANVLEIRKYNKEQNANNSGGYTDFTLKCIEGAGVNCRSGFLKDGVANNYFKFTQGNSSGGVCYNVTDDAWEACRYEEAVIR